MKLDFTVSSYLICLQIAKCYLFAASNFIENTSALRSISHGESPAQIPRPRVNFPIEKRSSYFSRRDTRFPYYDDDRYRAPRRQQRLEDFLWAGSGEGPIPPEPERSNGMAWEDDGKLGSSSKMDEIKVTKTMVLYKTVLSTVYPVALTPVVVTSWIHATPVLISSTPLNLLPSPSFDPISDFSLTPTTPRLTPIIVQPTVTGPLPTTTPKQPTTQNPRENEESSEGLHDKWSATSTDLRYWIQTTIKRKRESTGNDVINTPQFQESMQNKLAGIYAMAFKRQLLKTLGVIGQHEVSSRNMSRQRRSFSNSASSTTFFDVEGVDMDQRLYYTDASRIAKTAMNVTVSMVNVSLSEPENYIFMKYIVFAEGIPVPGFVAVKELRVITKEEMEKVLEYDVVNKAEALVQPLESYETGISSTPWLITLIALVCLMILILVLTMFMAWKWKQNHLRDRQEGDGSRAEGGREASIPKLSRHHQRETLSPSQEGTQAQRRPSSPTSSHFQVDEEGESPRDIGEGSHKFIQSSERQLVTSDEKSSSSQLVNPSGGSSYHSHSPRRRLLKTSGVAKKVSKRRKRKKSHIMSFEDESRSPRKFKREREVSSSIEEHVSFADNNLKEEEQFNLTTDLCRNLDKISYGNLDICSESLARTPSAQAKKILSRPSSHKQSQPHKTLDSEGLYSEEYKIVGENDNQINSTEKVEEESPHEQDRDLSEKSFEISDSVSAEITPRQDAEVQTPTRLIRRSPRVRTSPRRHRRHGKTSKLSLLSTESEEAVEFTNLHPSSSDELNPLGRMRKRFHQFLDDAFNVMASGRKENTEKGPQSARVTVSHEMKSKSTGRPWTSHVIREESLRKVRPKSSIVMPKPKPAWTVGSEQRRCQSAKSKKSVIIDDDDDSKDVIEECDFPHERQQEGIVLSSRSDGQHSLSDSSKALIFPKYPTYPEVEICLENNPNRTLIPGTSQQQGSVRSRLHPFDPAVPLIEAIKDEMKRFEKVKISTNDPNT